MLVVPPAVVAPFSVADVAVNEVTPSVVAVGSPRVSNERTWEWTSTGRPATVETPTSWT